ncbi:MAG TPA: ATP-binding protein [Usitatibacter sp.]|nr:ATP-binding protein [Usitatibacter sp.]
MLETFPKALPFREAPDFFAGGGEMGERMRELQWSRTPLGSPAEWPEPLRHAVRLMLSAGQPMSLWWGDAHTHLYNDACRALFGAGHPSALGMDARIVWSEWWSELGPRAEAALRRHEGSSTPPLPFIVERHGHALEAHYMMTCNAVRGEDGRSGGALWTFADVTASALRDREMGCLDALTRALRDGHDLRRTCEKACEALAADAVDLPFTALYVVDAAGREARLAARSGVMAGSEAVPEAIMLGEASPWPLREALAAQAPQRVSLVHPRFGRLACGPWDRAPREAVVVPVARVQGGARVLLVAALNPYRTFDVPFERFVALVAERIAQALERLRMAPSEALQELQELDRRRSEFLATLAHELRNPLAPLLNGLEVMRLASDDADKMEKARGMMQRQLGQMVRLVDDLLDVSRVSRGKMELRPADIEIAAALRTAVEASQPLMGERGHSLVAHVPPERIIVHGDAARLSQVFSNLLNNAAKYTEPGGRIELDALYEEGQVVVRVRDNGIGIPPEMQSRVFEIFTQVDRSLERAQGGLGIGLSIARRLVEMHGGTIQVRSDGHGKGSEFTVRLPARVERPVQAPRQEDRRMPSGPCRRILVADDNPDSAETLQIMLEVMGNEVRVAHDGEEAVKLAEAFQPDAILLDIGMPKLNGYDACSQIRARPGGADPLIVALTGWSQEEDKLRSKEAGFDRHLVKPVEPGTLEGLIQSLR